MQQRVERVRRDIRVLQQRRILSWSEARNLEQQAATSSATSSGGRATASSRTTRGRSRRQIRNLEFRVQREARDWNNRPGRRRY